MAPVTRSVSKNAQSGNLELESTAHKYGDSPATDEEQTISSQSTCDPVEQRSERGSNIDNSRLKTPSPKMPKPTSPPKVHRWSRHSHDNDYRFFQYSNEPFPGDEGLLIRERSKQNGINHFERFNEKYIRAEKSSPESTSAKKDVERVLDSPYRAPTLLPGAHTTQSDAHAPSQDAVHSESEGARRSDSKETLVNDCRGPSNDRS